MVFGIVLPALRRPTFAEGASIYGAGEPLGTNRAIGGELVLAHCAICCAVRESYL